MKARQKISNQWVGNHLVKIETDDQHPAFSMYKVSYSTLRFYICAWGQSMLIEDTTAIWEIIIKHDAWMNYKPVHFKGAHHGALPCTNLIENPHMWQYWKCTQNMALSVFQKTKNCDTEQHDWSKSCMHCPVSFAVFSEFKKEISILVWQ